MKATQTRRPAEAKARDAARHPQPAADPVIPGEEAIRERAYQKKILHTSNPVLNWAMGNAVTRQDGPGNIVLDKSKARERIDPVAALMNAHTRAMFALPEQSLGPQVLIF